MWVRSVGLPPRLARTELEQGCALAPLRLPAAASRRAAGPAARPLEVRAAWHSVAQHSTRRGSVDHHRACVQQLAHSGHRLAAQPGLLLAVAREEMAEDQRGGCRWAVVPQAADLGVHGCRTSVPCQAALPCARQSCAAVGRAAWAPPGSAATTGLVLACGALSRLQPGEGSPR